MTSYDVNFQGLPKGLTCGDKVYFAITLYVGVDPKEEPEVRFIRGCNQPEEALQFVVEEAPHGAFQLREVMEDGNLGHCMVRAGDWVNMTSKEDSETESLGWKSFKAEGSNTSWDTAMV